MGIEKQGSMPTGGVGKLIGILMNGFHTAIYKLHFEGNMPPNDSVILDIGCGGGSFIKYLAGENSTYKLFGVDHSQEMVDLSSQVNRSNENRVTILHASVQEMPIENASIDLATAFETIQFWPDIGKSILEVKRVLKNGGRFLIINRYPKEKTVWWKRAKIKSEKEYAGRLDEAGFSRVATSIGHRKGWIVVTAEK